ncbi:MAG: methyltransferase domain-containing protein, partial [Propionicimonas sp.]
MKPVIPRLKQRLNAALLQAFWNWAGVPSGPLGWVSSRTVLWSGSYPAVADALRLRPDDELLELGCGSAGFLAGQAGRVRRVAGIDLSDIQVDLARRRLARLIASGTAEIVAGDAAALPWPEDTFTVVTCMSVFEAFPNPEQVLSEVYRVLRPGGRAVLNIGERVAEGTQTHQAWGGITVWAEDDVRRMVEEAGFTDVTIHYVPWAEPGLVSRTFAKVIGPIGGDLRLAGGIKPSESAVDVRPDLPVKGEREVRTVARERRDSYAARPKPGRVPEFTRTITVDAPVEKVFAITRDPELWMGAFPGRIEISDVKVTPEGVGTTFRFTEKTFGMTSTGTHEYLEYVPDRRLVTKSSRGPVFTWTFERVDG